MTENGNNEDYVLLGKFNVPYVFPVKIIEKNLNIRKTLEDNLPKFKEGTETKQGEGFYVQKEIKSTEFIEENPNLKNILQRLTVIDYNYENYGNIRVFNKDHFVIEKRKLSIGLNNIFLLNPSLLIIKGSKITAQRFKDSFENIFKKDIILGQPYEFDPWFIIWIISKYRNDEYELDNDFFIDLMWDMKVEGSESDFLGKIISAKGSTDVTKSLSILFPLLKKLFPTEFMFSFTIEDLIGTIKINNNGRILIYLTRGILSEISSVERVIVGCYFIERLIILYEKWLKLPKKEKYASPDFIKDILRECDERGIEITTDIMETLEMYEDKRR